jgi:hypothetical protein
MDEHLDAVVSRAVLAPRPRRDVGDILSDYARSEGLASP